ncbi:DUF6542 domain-containing protein [Streptomyces sp. NPDC001530]|uniref:DUF6542 domain-containing protein n=1 Tax=Streptomyces sp. NPDC001530 TaxID=3364582 RepID=UPI003684BD82
MEQHRTRPPQHRPRRGAPVPAQAARGAALDARRSAPVARRPPPPLVQAVRRMPNPRLTGLGSGLFCVAVMFALACLDQLLFEASLVVYGVLFVPVCALTAVWVRRGDLVTAPVVVPIAFAIGLVPVADSGGGFGGRVMGLFTALATQAGWLYGGTLVAGLIVTFRKVRLMTRRAAQRRAQAAASRRSLPPARPSRPTG